VQPSFTKKPAKYSLSCSSLQAQGRLSTRSSKLDGCRAEVDDATPKLNIAFPNGSKRYGTFRALAFQAKSRPVPNAARMRAWSMTRSRCRYGREHTRREKLDGGCAWSLPGRPVKAAPENSMSWQSGLLQPEKNQLTRRSSG
jgi:hypothetical protein